MKVNIKELYEYNLYTEDGHCDCTAVILPNGMFIVSSDYGNFNFELKQCRVGGLRNRVLALGDNGLANQALLSIANDAAYIASNRSLLHKYSNLALKIGSRLREQIRLELFKEGKLKEQWDSKFISSLNK